MCGIFGYIGTKTDASQTVFAGLKTLEYRGYDSWGIAIRQKQSEGKTAKFIVEKHTGKIGNTKLNSHFSSLPSHISIGHTRWATHGGVTVENAHPHLDCNAHVSVVHNGIVENFNELKEMLKKKKHGFKSETDTEVVAHLIEEELKTKGFATAVRDAFNQLTGMNAIVVAYAPSKEIVAAKTGSPLAVGIGKNGYYVASDAAGIVAHTKDVVFLADHQMAILGESFQLIQLPDGKPLTPQITKLTWQFENADKGRYPHFILKEIHEQPKVIEQIALQYGEQTQKLAALIEKAYGTFFIACGSASYASLAGTYLFSSVAKKHVNFSIGSEFKYLEDYITPRTLVIPVSQSGESIDVIDPINKVKQKGAKVAAIVNVLGSTLYRQADFNLLLGAGQEKAVVATKSFFAMLSVMILTAFTLAKRQDEAKKILLTAAKNVQDILQNNQSPIKKLAKELKNKEHMYIIGRGLSYATAVEATLKIKETACLHAEGFAGGELKHGVIALIDKGTPCIVFAPNDETYDEIISNAQEIKARGGFIIGIGPKDNPVFDRFLPTADAKEATMLPQILYAQLLAYYLALVRGIKDPDKPKNLAKSVTVK